MTLTDAKFESRRAQIFSWWRFNFYWLTRWKTTRLEGFTSNWKA